jgi:hypothetical protein
MDPKLKLALIIVASALGGMLLLGTAFAVPAAFHALAGPRFTTTESYGPGMMGRPGDAEWGTQQGGVGPRGMMGGERGGMMGPQGPQRGYDGACPNGVDPSTCPNSGTCPNSADATGTSL